MSALAAMTRTETKLFFREPLLPLLVLALPVLLLVGFGMIPGFGDPSSDLGGQSGTEYIASLGVAIVLAVLGLSILPTTLGAYRERGVLRRLQATPVTPGTLLGAQLILVGAATVAAVVLLVGVGGLAFGVAVPRNLAGFVLAVVLGAAALLSIGLAVAALAPNGKASNAIGMTLVLPEHVPGRRVRPPGQLLPAAHPHQRRDPAGRGAAGGPRHLAGRVAAAGAPGDNGRVGRGRDRRRGPDLPLGVSR